MLPCRRDTRSPCRQLGMTQDKRGSLFHLAEGARRCGRCRGYPVRRWKRQESTNEVRGRQLTAISPATLAEPGEANRPWAVCSPIMSTRGPPSAPVARSAAPQDGGETAPADREKPRRPVEPVAERGTAGCATRRLCPGSERSDSRLTQAARIALVEGARSLPAGARGPFPSPSICAISRILRQPARRTQPVWFLQQASTACHGSRRSECGSPRVLNRSRDSRPPSPLGRRKTHGLADADALLPASPGRSLQGAPRNPVAVERFGARRQFLFRRIAALSPPHKQRGTDGQSCAISRDSRAIRGDRRRRRCPSSRSPGKGAGLSNHARIGPAKMDGSRRAIALLDAFADGCASRCVTCSETFRGHHGLHRSLYRRGWRATKRALRRHQPGNRKNVLRLRSPLPTLPTPMPLSMQPKAAMARMGCAHAAGAFRKCAPCLSELMRRQRLEDFARADHAGNGKARADARARRLCRRILFAGSPRRRCAPTGLITRAPSFRAARNHRADKPAGLAVLNHDPGN